jgi:hypothetical protein
LFFVQVFGCNFSVSSQNQSKKSKIYASAADAVADIPDGAKLLVGGFGLLT